MNSDPHPEQKCNQSEWPRSVEMKSSHEEKLRNLISKALMQSDLSRAAALLEQLCEISTVSDTTLTELREKVMSARDTIETISSLVDLGERSIESGQSGLAVVCFLEALKLSPDHEKAWIGLQTAQRKADLRSEIQTILAEVDAYRSSGKFESARERCEMLLRIAPDHEKTRHFLVEINHWIDRRRQAVTMLQQGDRLLGEHSIDAAIDVWEKIRDVDPSFIEPAERITAARSVKQDREIEKQDQILIRDALRYLDKREYEQALDVLAGISSDSALRVDATVIERKARGGLEQLLLIRDLEEKIHHCIISNRHNEAGMLLTTLEHLDPLSDRLRVFKGLIKS